MSDDYSMLLVRVIKGEESLATCFWTTTVLMGLYFGYEYYVPSFSDVFSVYFRFFNVCILTYTLVAIHHGCHDSSLLPRLAARTYVLLLMGLATLFCYKYYGLAWAAGYPFIAMAVGFVVQD